MTSEYSPYRGRDRLEGRIACRVDSPGSLRRHQLQSPRCCSSEQHYLYHSPSENEGFFSGWISPASAKKDPQPVAQPKSTSFRAAPSAPDTTASSSPWSSYLPSFFTPSSSTSTEVTLDHRNLRSIADTFSDRPLASSSPPPTPSTSSPSTSSTSFPPLAFPTSLSEVLANPTAVAILSATSGAGLTLISLRLYRRHWRRIRNAEEVTPGMIDGRRWINGTVTSVGDGDNFRLFHTPGPFYSYPIKIRSIPATTKELRNETLSIRIAGVDAPEAAHFGKQAQPHSQESLDWLRGYLLTPKRKRMKCQIMRKDQYGRIVAVPYVARPFPLSLILRPIPLPLEMLRTGMAVVYESGGAEYGPWGLEKMKAVEQEARAAKRGVWGLKNGVFEHPGDYKKRHKMLEEGAGDGGSQEDQKKMTKAFSKGLWRWISSWWRR